MTTETELIELLVRDQHIDRSMITSSTRFEDIGLDSLSLMEFMMTIEEHFNITIGEVGDHATTLEELVALIDSIRFQTPPAENA